MSETSSLTLSNMGRYGFKKGNVRPRTAKKGLCKGFAKPRPRKAYVRPLQSQGQGKAKPMQCKANGVFLGAGRKRCIGASN